jgi:molybdopterin molybdotransferase
MGVLAAVGRSQVSVIPRPRVAIVPTGDELVEPDRIPGPGQIRNSNATMLAALATEAGATAEALPIAPDQPAALAAALSQALASADVVVVAGGVSAGRLDLVPGTLEGLGVEKVFHKVRVKPGKPVWYGIARARADGSGALVFGLPGNPVSGLVGFLLFVRPALEILAGRPERGTADRTIPARLAREFTHGGDRPTYHPSRLLGGDPPEVEPLDWAGSADLRAVAAATGFAIFPPGDRQYAAGEIVRYFPFD